MLLSLRYFVAIMMSCLSFIEANADEILRGKVVDKTNLYPVANAIIHILEQKQRRSYEN